MKTKPVMIVSGDFVLTGGMDRANYALAHYLARQGTPVELVAYRVDEELLRYPNVTHHRVSKPAGSYFLAAHAMAREGLKRAGEVKRQGGFVIANGGNCLVGDFNWVHYVHAAYKPESTSLIRMFKKIIERRVALRAEHIALKQARTILVNSEATRSLLIEKLDIPDDRIETVYYGIDHSLFFPASVAQRQTLRDSLGWDASPRVIFIGALGDRRKGFDTLAKAWTLLNSQGDWDAKLVVVGAGSEHVSWKRDLKKSGHASSVDFLGFRRDVPDLLQAADCLVSPTRYEAYGLGVHEAICCGLPAFVSRKAGVAERYPTSLEDLLLDDPDNAEVLASKLCRWRQSIVDWASVILPFSQSLRARKWDDMALDFMEKIRC